MSLTKAAQYVSRVKDIHFWSPLNPLGPWGKEKPIQIYFFVKQVVTKLRILELTFRISLHSQCWPQAVVCISTPRMYPQSGYFLASGKAKFYKDFVVEIPFYKSINVWIIRFLCFYRLSVISGEITLYFFKILGSNIQNSAMSYSRWCMKQSIGIFSFLSEYTSKELSKKKFWYIYFTYVFKTFGKTDVSTEYMCRNCPRKFKFDIPTYI